MLRTENNFGQNKIIFCLFFKYIRFKILFESSPPKEMEYVPRSIFQPSNFIFQFIIAFYLQLFFSIKLFFFIKVNAYSLRFTFNPLIMVTDTQKRSQTLLQLQLKI